MESILLEKFGVDHVDLTEKLILGEYEIFEPGEKKYIDEQNVSQTLENEGLDKNEIVELILERAKTNLIELSPSIGKYDLSAFMLAKSLQELDSITQAIRKHPGVKRIAVNIWVSEPCFLLENLDLQPTRV